MYLNAFLPITNFTIQIGEFEIKIYALTLILIGVIVFARFSLLIAATLKIKQNYKLIFYAFAFVYFASRSVDLNAFLFITLLFFVFLYNITFRPKMSDAILAVFVIAFSAVLYFTLPEDCSVNDYRVIDRAIFTNDICAVRYESGDIIRLMGFSSDPNHWSLFLVSAIFLLSKLGTKLSWFVFFVNLLTFSRAGVASSLIALTEKFGNKIKIFVLFLSIPLAFIVLYFIRGYELDITEIGRFVIWGSYIVEIISSGVVDLIFGHGADLVYTITVDGSDFDRAPHNTLILVMYQFGAVGAIAFLIILWHARSGFMVFLPFLMTLDLFYSPVYWMILGLSANVKLNHSPRN